MRVNTAMLPAREITPGRVPEPKGQMSGPVVLGVVIVLASLDRIASVFVRRVAEATPVVVLPAQQRRPAIHGERAA